MSVIRDIIETTLANHPDNCIFVSDAVDVIEERVGRWLLIGGGANDKAHVIELIATAITDAELYCPHEGINRMPTT